MNRQFKIILAIGIACVVGGTGIALAQGAEDPAVASARAAGTVGEQADGYLGIASGGSPGLKAAVDAINIKRRAIYTDLAGKRGATVQEVAAARGCDQLRTRVGPGQTYLLADGRWRTREGAAPIDLPAYCS